ncbi:hypothetical protein C8J57DRAFT_1497205 [Mycena rebaudengoi]|nr:hypothetical protein C8J57DRAFT_1497205 [Mycena rebaudengoi]
MPQTDSLQLDPPFIEESSDGVRRPCRLRAMKEMFRSFKKSKGPTTGRNITAAEGTSSPVALHSQPEPTGGDTRRTHKTGAVIDNLALVVSIVESISNTIDKFPYVGPVAALLSQILKTCREIKDMHEQRDLLVARLAKTAGDLHGTIMRMEANNHTDSTGRLKADIEEYVGQGRFRTTALQTEWTSKFSTLDRELDSFGARFNVNRLADIQIEQGVIHKKVDDGRTALLKEKLEKWLKPADMSEKQHETQKLHHEGTGIWFLDGRQLTEWIEKPGSLWIEGNSGTGKSVISSTVIRKLLHDRPPSDHGTVAVGYFYFDFRDDKKQLVDTMLRSVVFQLSGQSINPYAALNVQYGKLSQGQTLPTTQDLLNILDELLLEFCCTYIVLDALDECRNTDQPSLVELLSKLRTRTESSLHLLLTSQPREIFTVAFKGVKRVVMGSKTTQKDIERFVSSEVQSRFQRLRHWDHWKPRAAEIIAKVVEKSNGMFRLAACLLIEFSRPKLNPSLDTILANLPNELYGIYDRFMETIDKDDCVYVERILRWLLFSARQLTLPQLEDALAFDFSDRGPAPTSTYAAQCWSHHLLRCHDRAALLTSTARLLVSGSKQYQTLNRLCQPIGKPVFTPPLYMCSLIGYREGVEYLLRNGTDANAVGGQFHNALQVASVKCHTDVIRTLLENGADVNAAGGSYYRSALQTAAAHGHTEVVRILLENGADINSSDGSHGSALQIACTKGHFEVVHILIKHGANMPGDLLQTACTLGHVEVVRILIEHGADINSVGELHEKALGHRIRPSRRKVDTEKMDVINKMLLQGRAKRYAEIDRISRENGAVGG